MHLPNLYCQKCHQSPHILEIRQTIASQHLLVGYECHKSRGVVVMTMQDHMEGSLTIVEGEYVPVDVRKKS